MRFSEVRSMGGRAVLAIMAIICAVLMATGGAVRGNCSPCGGSSVLRISGRVYDFESGRPASVGVRVYGMGGELLESAYSLEDGSWSSSLSVPPDAGMLAVQAGGSGYFIRTVFVDAADGAIADMKVVADDLVDFNSFAYDMAHGMDRAPRLSRFAPGRPAVVKVFAKNPFNGSRFDPAALGTIIKALLDPEYKIARLLGKDLLDVDVVTGGQTPELGPGMVFIVPDAELPLLGLCSWAYDGDFNTLAACIGLSTRLEGKFMVEATLLHEMAHIVFPNDSRAERSVLSTIVLQDRYTEYDLRCALVANEPSFTSNRSGGETAGPSDYLANVLGTEWGSFVAPEL